MDNYANDTIMETTNENEKSAKKSRVTITGVSLLNGINEKALSKDNLETIETTKGKNVLNNVKKIIKSVKRFSTNKISVFKSDCSER